MIEPVYGMTRPADDDNSRRARTYRATYEMHDRAGEFTSVLFAQQHYPTASELLLGGSIFPAMQNFLLAARAQGLGACLTSWASYGGERLLRDASACPRTGWLPATSWSGGPRGSTGRCAAARLPSSSTSTTGARRPVAFSQLLRAEPATEPARSRLALIDTSYAEFEIITSRRENGILARAATTGGGPDAVGVRC